MLNRTIGKAFNKALIVLLALALTACGAAAPAATTTAPAGTTAAAATTAAATTAAATTAAATTAAATTAAATKAAATTATPATTAKAAEAANEALPTWLTQEKVTLSFLTHSGFNSAAPPPSNDLPKWQETERLTNVHIDFEVILNSEYRQILNVRFAAGGNLPDIINHIDNPAARLPELLKDGMIIDQTQLYHDRYPYTRALIANNGTHPYSETMYEQLYDSIMCLNGTFYGPTQIVPAYASQIGLMINKYWLEAVNRPFPETVDELYEVLLAFRNEDPNGNGVKDEVPLSTEAYCISSLANAFGLEFGASANGYGLKAVNGQLEYQRTHPNYREYLKYLNKLFSEGLLDADYQTTDLDALYAYASNNKTGVVNWWMGSMVALSGYSPYSGDEYNIEQEVFHPTIKPLSSAFGPGTFYWRRGNYDSVMTITKDNKNVELSADWIDFLFAAPESMDLVAFGVEGKSYYYDENGDMQKILDDTGAWARHKDGGGQQPHAYLEANTRMSNAFQPQWRNDNLQAQLPYFTEGTVQLIFLTPDENERVKDNASDMSTYVNEMHTAFIIGTKNINDDAAWNEYVNTVNSLGLPVYMEEYQKAYNRKYGGN